MDLMEKFPRKIKIETVKALLARTGNQCAFPNCDHPIFNDNNLLIAQLCHIEAIAPEGPRFNPNNTTLRVNSYDNLIFLCYRHHKETDDSIKFDKDKLKEIKADHESKFKESKFKIDNETLNKVVQEINEYWTEVYRINNDEHLVPELKIDIDPNADEEILIADIKQKIKDLVRISDFLRESLKSKYFEIVCLALPNTTDRLTVLIQQLEIKIMERKLVNDPTNDKLKKELENLKSEFVETARSAGVAD